VMRRFKELGAMSTLPELGAMSILCMRRVSRCFS
jgi:hypothetical protein